MNRKLLRNERPGQREFFGFFLCLIFFVAGVVVGTLSAGNLPDSEIRALESSMAGRIGQIADGTYVAPRFLSAFWSLGNYHLLVLFLGFSLLGAFVLPLLSAVRGFYLSFSIAAFIQVFGVGDWPVAFSLFGVSSIIAIPCFFLLASQAFAASTQLGRTLMKSGNIQAKTLYNSHYIMRTVLCFLGLMAAVLIELYVTPSLVAWVSVALK